MAKDRYSRLKKMNNFENLVENAMGDEKALESLGRDNHALKAGVLQVSSLPVESLHAFPNHPFQVMEDQAMEQLIQSVKNCGLIHPVIVRKDDQADGYMIISGHRRHQACIKAGLSQIPAYIVEVSLEEATIMMADANFFQRKDLLHSERPKPTG